MNWIYGRASEFLRASKKFLLVSLSGAVVATIVISSAPAQFAVFDSELLAQLRCPTDEVVWLDFKKRRYYTNKQRLYGQGRDASFVCRKEANSGGYRRSRLGVR
jgi:hypothetical protein